MKVAKSSWAATTGSQSPDHPTDINDMGPTERRKTQ
jgi:hypothetical protein